MIVAGTSYTDTGLTNGTTYYYVVSGTNGVGEGTDSNQASATPAVPPTVVTFTSVVSHDGWVLESSETGNAGGSIDSMYKSVVSFDTSAIPDGATILSATLRLRESSSTSTTTTAEATTTSATTRGTARLPATGHSSW